MTTKKSRPKTRKLSVTRRTLKNLSAGTGPKGGRGWTSIGCYDRETKVSCIVICPTR
jgi:hypothetical protein